MKPGKLLPIMFFVWGTTLLSLNVFGGIDSDGNQIGTEFDGVDKLIIRGSLLDSKKEIALQGIDVSVNHPDVVAKLSEVFGGYHCVRMDQQLCDDFVDGTAVPGTPWVVEIDLEKDKTVLCRYTLVGANQIVVEDFESKTARMYQVGDMEGPQEDLLRILLSFKLVNLSH